MHIQIIQALEDSRSSFIHFDRSNAGRNTGIKRPVSPGVAGSVRFFRYVILVRTRLTDEQDLVPLKDLIQISAPPY